MNAQASNLFTASQIGRALSVKRQAAQRLLSGTAPGGIRIMSGVESAAWSIEQLPASLQSRLEAAAAGPRRQLDAEHGPGEFGSRGQRAFGR